MARGACYYIGAVTAKPQGRRAITSHADIVSFGRFRLDRKRRVLLCDGQPVTVGAKALDLLECLIDGRAGVMSKQNLLTCVWPGRVVGENNLPVQVHSLRTALAPHGGDGLILGVANGYRFVGDVAEAPEPTARPDPPHSPTMPVLPPAPEPVRGERAWERLLIGRRRGLFIAGWVVALLAGVEIAFTRLGRDWSAPTPPRLSIAVRPFGGIGLPPGQAFLAPAITEDLTTDLAHIPGSVVIARASADAPSVTSLPSKEMGRVLGVRYLLEGAIEPAATGFRINAHLIEAANGHELWAERFDMPAEALADTQSTIVRRIASALDTELTEFEGARALRERPDNPDAEDLFYGGRSLLDHDDSMAGFTRAQHMLEEAVRRRPDFLDAQAQLGLTLVLKKRSHDDPTAEQDLREARDAISAALAASRPSATALAADARLLEGDGDCSGAEQRSKAALALEPNSVDALTVLARCAANEGRLDEAAADEEMVLRLNPESGRKGRFSLLLSQVRLMQARYSEAIDSAHQAADATDRPQSTTDCMGRVEYAHILLISATALAGDKAGAKQLYAEYAARWPNRSVWRIGTYAARRFSELPGYHRFLDGLGLAGMPTYASEPRATPAAASACSEFVAVPPAVAGAETINTAGMSALIARSHPHVIDLGSGAAVIDGADWLGDHPPGTTLEDLVDRGGRSDRNEPVVVMGSGLYGDTIYAGVRELVASGYRRVLWYRGGEEAWTAAGLPASDRRLQY